MSTTESPAHFSRRLLALAITLVLVILPALSQSGCTRSLRTEATKVASVGGEVSKQLAEYLELLQQDTIDTYELTAFRDGYETQKAYDLQVERAKARHQPIPPPPSSAMSATDKEIFLEYQKTYQALGARVGLARAMQNAYESYAQLSAYDSSQEVLNSMDGLIQTVSAAASFPLPGLGGSAAGLVDGMFRDIVRELTTIKQNRKLLKDSNRLIPIVERLKAIFDLERILYGGDTAVTDSVGVRRNISGSAGRRAAAYRLLAGILVQNDAVISTPLLNRVLARYELRWPDPQLVPQGARSGCLQRMQASVH